MNEPGPKKDQAQEYWESQQKKKSSDEKAKNVNG
jgi:hypothetical protein